MMTPEQGLSEPGYDRELRLAIAIVEQALQDIRHYGRTASRLSPIESQRHLDRAKRNADDARDFLLHRLWDQPNPFGDLLRHHGVSRFDAGRLIHAAANCGEPT